MSGDELKSMYDYITFKLYSFDITVTKTLTQIGCKRNTNVEWKKRFKEIAKGESVSSSKVKLIKAMVEMAIKELNKKKGE